MAWASLLVTLALASTLLVQRTTGDCVIPRTGPQLIVNPDAETGSLAGWNTQGIMLEVVKYGDAGFPDLDSSTAIRGGTYMFGGGNGNAHSNAVQQLCNVNSLLAKAIDAGAVTFSFGGYFGGWEGQDDYMQMSVTFGPEPTSARGTTTVSTPRVTAADRGYASIFVPRNASGTVPTRTRTISISLDSYKLGGNYNDGYADNLFLTLGRSSAHNCACSSPSQSSSSA